MYSNWLRFDKFQVTAINYYLLILGFLFVGMNMDIRRPNFSVLLSEEVGMTYIYFLFAKYNKA